MINLRYKYRIYPSKEQTSSLLHCCGSQRYIWNHFLRKEIERYQVDQKFNFYNTNASALTDLKKKLVWLNDVPAISLQQTLRYMDQALKQSFSELYGSHLEVADRYFPSSQKCSNCGSLQKMPLNARTYTCKICDLKIDRDLNAAINIDSIGQGLAKFTPVDVGTQGKDILVSSLMGLNEEAGNRISKDTR